MSLVPETTEEELKMAVDVAQTAYQSWREISVIQRQQRMFDLQRLIKAHTVSFKIIYTNPLCLFGCACFQEQLAAIIQTELGKTKADARGDVHRGLRTLNLIFYLATKFIFLFGLIV